MSETAKNPMTVKEYSVQQHISQQAVYPKIRRNADKLQSHIFKQNGRKCLNETAQKMLKPVKGNAGIVAKSLKLENIIRAKTSKVFDIKELTNKCEDLRKVLSKHNSKITSLEQEISDEKAKTSQMEKRIKEHTEKSSSFENLAERFNALFTVLDETANTGIGKKSEVCLQESIKRVEFNGV